MSKFNFAGLYGSVKGFAKPFAQNVAKIVGPPQQPGQKDPGFKSSLRIIGQQFGRPPPQQQQQYQPTLPPSFATAAAASLPPVSQDLPPPPPPPRPQQDLSPPPPTPELPPSLEMYNMCKEQRDRTEEELRACLEIIRKFEAFVKST